MEFLVVVAACIFFAPITLAIVAMVKVGRLRDELRGLHAELDKRYVRHDDMDLGVSKSRSVSAETRPMAKPAPQPVEVHRPIAPSAARPEPVQRPMASIPPFVPKQSPSGLEFVLGGRAAAFAGIAILVAGIVFLVGYAIQNAWLGPGMRVMLGLTSGVGLAGAGHWVGRRDEKYTLFSRVLTGGGSALFYFTVFMAYAFYHLIGPVGAGIGLFLCAAGIFALAMFYRSQSVAVLGVLGGFITPLLVGGELDAGVFALVYIAVINVPVILLGLHRKWQVLYNLAFVFTAFHFLVWMDRVPTNEAWIGVGFALVFFLQYIALGLLKLRSEQKVSGRTADLVRLILSSALLMAAMYGLLEKGNLDQWTGLAFILIGLMHVGLAKTARKRIARFSGEVAAIACGGVLFLAMALPAQLDGAWISLGWGMEGAILAWFAMRERSHVLRVGAVLLGMAGLLKGLLYDISLYDVPPRLFLNARFGVVLVSALLLGVQGRIANRVIEDSTSRDWRDMLWWFAILGFLALSFSDIFWTVGFTDARGWLLTSLFLLGAGTALVWIAPARSTIACLGAVMLIAVPAKLLFVDAFIVGGWIVDGGKPFANTILWFQLVMAISVAVLIPRRLRICRGELIFPVATLSMLLNLTSLGCILGLLSLEMHRVDAEWGSMAMTIFWALGALALILYGMKAKRVEHRYFGLVLFSLTTLKVLLIDASALKGLERIGAFLGTGALLLLLSFAYQKASAYFEARSVD